MAAIVHFPPHFDECKRYQRSWFPHPGGGVKEQTAGLYASKLAEQGSSPSPLTAPIRARARASRVSWRIPMSAPGRQRRGGLPDHAAYVDQRQIGAMGICARAGYSANAAIQDRRIKALGMVSTVSIGQMFPQWLGQQRQGCRCHGVSGVRLPGAYHGCGRQRLPTIPLAPLREDAPGEELREAWEYPHPALRAPNTGLCLTRNLNQIIT